MRALTAVVVRLYKGRCTDRFLALLHLNTGTGEIACEAIVNLLKDKNMPFKNLIGFGADNYSTIMDKVQARLKEINPNIYVISCICHNLNLVA